MMNKKDGNFLIAPPAKVKKPNTYGQAENSQITSTAQFMLLNSSLWNVAHLGEPWCFVYNTVPTHWHCQGCRAWARCAGQQQSEVEEISFSRWLKRSSSLSFLRMGNLWKSALLPKWREMEWLNKNKWTGRLGKDKISFQLVWVAIPCGTSSKVTTGPQDGCSFPLWLMDFRLTYSFKRKEGQFIGGN